MEMDLGILTKADEDALLQCHNFSDLLTRAIGVLERDDYYNISTPIKDLEVALHKLVVIARAQIFSKRVNHGQ